MQTLVTATTSPEALAAAEQACQAILSHLLTPGRDRHSDRTRKHQPRFPRSKKTTPTTRGRPTVNLSQSPVHPP